jgi:hypothetical protein
MMIPLRPNRKPTSSPRIEVGKREKEIRKSKFEIRSSLSGLKLAVILVYGFGLLMPAALGAGPSSVMGQSEQVEGKTFRLDVRGTRGVVLFNHKTHEARLNPDANAPYKAKAGAACTGCHHTMNSRGVPQLWKCSACHRGEGDSGNPKNRDFDEVWSERAFHDSCIGCHRASAKGPTTCGECHKRGL